MSNQFDDYLIIEVGFMGGEIITVPEYSSLGFRRPIYVLKKPFNEKAKKYAQNPLVPFRHFFGC